MDIFKLIQGNATVNIFYLDTNPECAARYQCDKHVVKMVLESAQIMCAVLHRYGISFTGIYKPTHTNHPSVRWAGDSQLNYSWLAQHAVYLCLEYQRRYNRKHKSQYVIAKCIDWLDRIPNGPFTEPPQCMPEKYHDENTVDAYRRYYFFEKSRIASYTNTELPFFMEADYWAEHYDGGQRVETPAQPVRELGAGIYSVEHDLRIDINAGDLRAELLAHGVSLPADHF